MSHIVRGLFFCSLMSLGHYAMADGQACMFEGTYRWEGKDLEFKDCMQAVNEPKQVLIKTCEDLYTSLAPSNKAMTMTFINACPSPYQGSCDRLFGKSIAGYYYKKDESSLAGAKRGCIAQGAKWHQGELGAEAQ